MKDEWDRTYYSDRINELTDRRATYSYAFALSDSPRKKDEWEFRLNLLLLLISFMRLIVLLFMNCKHSINSLWLRVNLLIELLNLPSRVNSLISYFTLPRYDRKRNYWMKPFPEPEPIPYGTVSSLFLNCKLINLFLFIPSKPRSKKMKGCSLRSLWSLWLDSLPLFIEVNRRMILFTLLRGKWNRSLSVSSLCLNCKQTH